MKGVLRLALSGIAALTGSSMSNQATAQVAAERAPPEWIAYAQVSGDTIRAWIEGEDPVAVRFKAYLESSWQDGAKPAPVLALRIWVDDRGTITRADFLPFAHAEANADLTGLLVGHVLGAPPKGMLLPLRLSISLAPASRPAGDGGVGKSLK
jgi:hypothetical protein